MSLEPLIHVKPATGLAGKFSMHYCIASALVDGAVDLSTFNDAKVGRPNVVDLIGRTTMEVDEQVRHAVTWVCALTPTQTLRKAGLLAQNCWLKEVRKTLWPPT